MTYRKLAPGDFGYARILAYSTSHDRVCDAYAHNDDAGCPNPDCWKHPEAVEPQVDVEDGDSNITTCEQLFKAFTNEG